MPVDICTPDPPNDQWVSQVTGQAFALTGSAAGAVYSDSNPPWALAAGESVNDNLPSGVNVVNYSGTGANFGADMAAIRAAQTQPYYVRLPAGEFHITDFSFGVGTHPASGRGYQDVAATKLWAGLIGAGADQTFITVDAGIMSSTQLSGVTSGDPNPLQISALFLGAMNTPVFFSGITFRGNFQQNVTLSGGGNITMNTSTPTPAPWQGLAFTETAAGSAVQFCRFQGLGFAGSAFPPYEMGAFNSSHGQWAIRRTEIDGRLSADIDPTQPVASGGLMPNFEAGQVSIIDSWLHHTRRSGFAFHDHDPGSGGNASDVDSVYTENFQIDHIADTTDSFAGGHMGFACSNVEELRHTFQYVRPRFTASGIGTVTDGNNGQIHIVLATSNGNTITDGITVTDPVCSGTPYDDLLVIRVIKTPNGFGTSPIYTAIGGGSNLAAMPATVTNNGKTLTPVLWTNYNSALHNSANNYVVVAN